MEATEYERVKVLIRALLDEWDKSGRWGFFDETIIGMRGWLARQEEVDA